MYKRRTIKNSILFSGIALHSGIDIKMKLVPYEGGDIIIKRTDINKQFNLSDIKIFSTNLATNLGTDSCQIGTVEHLFSTLHVFKITDLIIELSGPEIPILDGSALPFFEAIKTTSFKELETQYLPLKPKRKIEIIENEKYISIEPYNNSLMVNYEIFFENKIIGTQKINLEINEKTFETQIAPARTFGFIKDIEKLKQAKLAQGASLNNVIALNDSQILNVEGLRFKDEFIRHKIVDLTGDLYLKGIAVCGKVTARYAGHALHQKILQKLQ